MILLNSLILIMIPMLIVSAVLAFHARWRWNQLMDNILRGMKMKDVRERVDNASKHRQWAKIHAAAVAIGIVASIIYMSLNPVQLGNYYRPIFDDFPVPVFFWVYGLFIPHMIALMLYHIRWNPNTLQRKQKLDDEDAVYQGNYDLDPDARYGVNEEGELIQLAMQDEAVQRLQQS